VFQVELLRGVQGTLRGLAGVAAQDAAEEPLSRQPCERQVECRDVGLLLRREIELDRKLLHERR